MFFQVLIASDPTVENGSLYDTSSYHPSKLRLLGSDKRLPDVLGVGLFISSIKLVGVLVVWDSKLKLP